ncbi:MAG TPA: methionyl-tRNA formyltransferase [Thermodesulfovibrionales bacterium]|nr:methionyl-tRNA formyltransferase [Thermodesulfovibrionales bacterium]
MSIIFFGTPEFAVPSLKALIDFGEDISLVITQTDKLKGRGHSLAAPPVKIAALETGLRVMQPTLLRDEGLARELTSLGPEFIVVVAYGKIIPARILEVPARGCINVHASLLPNYRGAAPIQWAIMKGEKRTGVTTMLMDEGLDTGPILLQNVLEIDPHETAGSLSQKLSSAGAKLLMETLKRLREGSVIPAPQTGEASYAPPLKKEDGLIDWSQSAVEICDFIRAMRPWPGAYCYVNTERVTLLDAEAMDGDGRPGMTVKVDKGKFIIATGRGLLSVREVQPAGRKPMPASAFVIGRHLTEGMSIR